MVALTADGEQLRRLENECRGFQLGSIRVVDAVASVEYDPEGAPYVQLDLGLAPPPRDRDTWNVDDVFEIHDQVRRTSASIGLMLSVSVSLHTSDDGNDENGPAGDGLGSALDNNTGPEAE
jgi:hypothetical protein